MPRLKRLKYERLYLPDKGMVGDFLNLAGVLSRPIRWDLIEQQYDEMIKHAVALKTGTVTPEPILKRFNLPPAAAKQRHADQYDPGATGSRAASVPQGHIEAMRMAISVSIVS